MTHMTPTRLAAQQAEARPLDNRSRHLRRLVVEGLLGGGRGHIGSSMSPIEILRVLYDEVMRYDPANPAWAERDRFILSKGHGCLAQYALLADKGFIPREALGTFCKRDSILGGHPEFGKIPGVEASTGALGHGLSIGVGMAMAARIQKRDSRVFVVMGDGEINEGSVWEAAMSAGKHRLSNLVAIVDYNKIQSYSFTDEVQPLDPLPEKWASFGFDAHEVDGHDVSALSALFRSLPQSGKPTAIIAHTVKGRGVPFAEHQPSWHHKNKFTEEEVRAIAAALEDC